VVGGVNVDGGLGPGVPGRTGTRARATSPLPSLEMPWVQKTGDETP